MSSHGCEHFWSGWPSVPSPQNWRSEDMFVCLKSYDEGRRYQCNELLHLHEKRTMQKSIPWVIRITGIAMI